MCGYGNVGEAKHKINFVVESDYSFWSQWKKWSSELQRERKQISNLFIDASNGICWELNHEPILDKWVGKKDQNQNNGRLWWWWKTENSRNLNKGIGGEHGIDKFNPAGVIQNRKDKNTTSLDQNPELFAFNNEGINAPSSSGSKIAKILSLDSNGNPSRCSTWERINASPLVLRSAEEGLISIVNTNKEGRKSKRLKKSFRENTLLKGILNSKRNDAKGIKSSKLKVWGDLKWDGLIYNPRGKEENAPESKDTKDPATKIRGQFEPIAEGQYFYKFKYRLTKDYPWQVSYIL